MNEAVMVYTGAAADARLVELGLEQEPLREVVRESFDAFISCSPDHPPLVRGIWAWGEAVRALREYTLPLGWRRSDEKNYSVVIDDERGHVIAVATGDEATGIAALSPSTRSVKGVSTWVAIVTNQAQLNLFSDTDMPAISEELLQDGARQHWVTWILLIHRAQNEVRCELSIPSSMGVDGKINAWNRRIILAAVPTDGERIRITVPEMDDIEVDVQRKA